MKSLLGAFVLSAGLALASGAVAQPDAAAVRILFGGDTGHAESYHELYPLAGEPDVIATRGYDYSLEKLAPILRRADYTVLNLETPLTLRKTSPLAGKDYYHWSHPERATETLAAYGVDAVSLANNHTLDFGLGGLEDSFEALRRYGVS